MLFISALVRLKIALFTQVHYSGERDAVSCRCVCVCECFTGTQFHDIFNYITAVTWSTPAIISHEKKGRE